MSGLSGATKQKSFVHSHGECITDVADLQHVVDSLEGYKRKAD